MNIFGIKIPEKIIYPLISIVIAYILILFVNHIIYKAIEKNKTKEKHIQRSQNTVLLLIKNIIKYSIIFMTCIQILKIYGVDTTALITGVGAISIIAGLALQDILKDYLVGMSIVLESQFAIGELVEINGFKGEVIYLSLKTTKIKSLTGEIKIIPNRNIQEVINYSLNKSLMIFEISISYEDKIEKVEKVLKELAKKLPTLVEEINEEVVYDGISSLSDSSVIYRLSTMAKEKDRATIKRKVNKELKIILDKNNIKIPYPQLEVHS